MATKTVTAGGKGYNDGPYDASANPYGLANGGHRQGNNLINMMLDVLGDASASLQDTSVTSRTIASSGTFTFTLVNNRPIPAGVNVFLIEAATPANFMYGLVTDHTDAVITVDVVLSGGSGTIAAWTVQPAGPRGPQGNDYWDDPVVLNNGNSAPADPYDLAHRGLYFIDTADGAVEVNLPATVSGRVGFILVSTPDDTDLFRINPDGGAQIMGQTADYSMTITSLVNSFALRDRAGDWRF